MHGPDLFIHPSTPKKNTFLMIFVIFLVFCSVAQNSQAEPPPAQPWHDVCAFDGRGGRRARVAVIGDFGSVGPSAQAVARLVDSWDPDAVLTTGDNNYPLGLAATLDLNVGSMYQKYIYPYNGSFGVGEVHGINRFFPALGNHDWYVLPDDDDDDDNDATLVGAPAGPSRGFGFNWPWDDDNDNANDRRPNGEKIAIYSIPGVLTPVAASDAPSPSLSAEMASRLNVTRLLEVLQQLEGKVVVHGMNLTELALQALGTPNPSEFLSWVLRVKVPWVVASVPPEPSRLPGLPRIPPLPPIRDWFDGRNHKVAKKGQRVVVQASDLPEWVRILFPNVDSLMDFELLFDNDLPTPFLDFFNLPGNERYYEWSCGPVDFFVIDSYWKEPDGITPDSVQAIWLRDRLAASKAERPNSFRVVCLHHPPYTSSAFLRGPQLQWPFLEWGVDLVVSGHNHVYERLNVGGLQYVVNGRGGAWDLYGGGDFDEIDPNSLFRYKDEYGAMLITVESDDTYGLMRFTSIFYSIQNNGTFIDGIFIDRPMVGWVAPVAPVPVVVPPVVSSSLGGSASSGVGSFASSVLGSGSELSNEASEPEPVSALFDEYDNAAAFQDVDMPDEGAAFRNKFEAQEADATNDLPIRTSVNNLKNANNGKAKTVNVFVRTPALVYMLGGVLIGVGIVMLAGSELARRRDRGHPSRQHHVGDSQLNSGSKLWTEKDNSEEVMDV